MMTQNQWEAFLRIRDEFRADCAEWATSSAAALCPLQEQVSGAAHGYRIETPVVYNRALDDVAPADAIKYIIVGDNPGREEQLAKNRRYLAGQSGRLAEGFFRRAPELKTDFRRNAVVLNKTPIHTAKTSELRSLLRCGDADIRRFFLETQNAMARLACALHAALNDGEVAGGAELWLVGYAELKGRGLFAPYREALKARYEASAEGRRLWDSVFVYQHFSMNRFSADLNAFQKGHALPLRAALHELGRRRKEEVFGTLSR